jgi:hypothetical protein
MKVLLSYEALSAGNAHNRLASRILFLICLPVWTKHSRDMANPDTAQGWILPAEVESARRQLAALFLREDETLETRQNMQRALAILQAYPELAEECFRVPDLLDVILNQTIASGLPGLCHPCVTVLSSKK